MPFSIIVAIDNEGGISREGKMAWRIPRDLTYFKETVKGHAIIMGRKTLEAMGGPMRDCYNYVVSSDSTIKKKHPSIIGVFPTLLSAKKHSQDWFRNKEIFIIGGRRIYQEALERHICNKIYLTKINHTFDCDNKVSEFIGSKFRNEYELEWSSVSRGEYEIEFTVWTRRDNPEERHYLNVMGEILTKGIEKEDRTGTGTLSLFGQTIRFHVTQIAPGEYRFPLLTTKRTFLLGVFAEQVWFVQGNPTDDKLRAAGVNIWKHNSSSEFLTNHPSPKVQTYREGELGPVYGMQWRHWGAAYEGPDADYTGKGIDQLQRAVDLINNNPNSRRILVNSWNVGALDEMALPPCHFAFQFYVRGTYLDVRVDMRSADYFLGVPFNIASYSLLLIFISQICNLEPGEVIIQMGDTHIYKNHIKQCKRQLNRTPLQFPVLKVNKPLNSLADVESLVFDDIELKDYNHYKGIKAKIN